MARILRISTILVILFVVQGWSRPNKDFEYDYPEDDDNPDNEYTTEFDSDGSQNDVGPPEIKSQPVTLNVLPGDTIRLPCEVKHADAFAVVWKKNDGTSSGETLLYSDGTPFITETSRIKLINNTLVIYNATASDASERYVCQLTTDPVTEIVHRVFIRSEIKVTPSKHTVVNYGEDVELGCKSNRQPNAEIKWSLEGKRLPTGDETVKGNTIKIHKATRHHVGRYQCLIDDHTKNPHHESIELVVNYPPDIEVEQESVHTGTGWDSELSCIVHAHPSADVTWLKDNKHLVLNDRVFADNIESRHVLILKQTKDQDLDMYTCQASNSMGTVSRNISLTGVPTKANYSGGEVGEDDDTLILKWRLQSFSPITEYKLQYRRKGESSWVNVTPRVTDGKGAGETIYTVEHPLKGLESGVYEAVLIARNDYGWSPKGSEPIVFNGEYVSVEKTKNATGSAITSRPLLAFTTLLLVVSSCVSMSL